LKIASKARSYESFWERRPAAILKIAAGGRSHTMPQRYA
jgi:hypothetical protein